jgi:hypothetical protein
MFTASVWTRAPGNARELLRFWPHAYLDEDRCRALLRALESYRAEWNAERKTFALTPRKDWPPTEPIASVTCDGAPARILVPPPTGHGAPRALQLDHPGPPRRRPPRAPTGCETLWKPVPWHRAIPGARRPRHDWASHAADALRYLAQGIPGVAAPSPGRPVRVPMPAYDFTAPARRLIGLGPGSELL